MLYFTHPACLDHDPRRLMPGHPDTPERLVAIEAALAERNWLGAERREAPAASVEQLEYAHTARLVSFVRGLCEGGGGGIDPDTVVGPDSWEAALRAAGGAIALALALLAGDDSVGYAAVRPSGHHAEADAAMGFCLFDNVAIAAEAARREGGAERVLILDWDVHHGNGTAEIFRERADVLFFSIHQSPLYPGTGPAADVGSGAGEGFTANLPVAPGSGEAEWLSLLEHVVAPVAGEFHPDLILISAGYDAHRADPLAGVELESDSFGRMAARLRELGAELGAPVGAVQEGGYDVPSLVESLLATMRALGGEGEAPRAPRHGELTERARATLAPYWPSLRD